MIYLWLIVAALAVAILFLFGMFIAMKSANELTKSICNNCKFYDRELKTCWAKIETRQPGDKACALSVPRDDDPNT